MNIFKYMNSLTQFQNQFGRNIGWTIAIILILIGLFSFPVGLLFIGLGVFIIWFIRKHGKKIDNK